MLLNRFAYFYLVPVIDMGIDIGLGDRRILGADARVTTVQPGARCLLCRNVIDTARAHAEHLERIDPVEYKRRVRGTLRARRRQLHPAVVHFTTDAAAMAIDELIHRLTGYRSGGSSGAPGAQVSPARGQEAWRASRAGLPGLRDDRLLGGGAISSRSSIASDELERMAPAWARFGRDRPASRSCRADIRHASAP